MAIGPRRARPAGGYLPAGGDEGAARARRILAGWGLNWLVLRPVDAGERRRTFERLLNQVVADQTPVCADERAQLWHLPTAPVVMHLGAGWHALEELGAGLRYRWLGQRAAATVFVPAHGPARLTLTGWAVDHQRTVEVWHGSAHLGALVVPHGQPATMSLTVRLPAGVSQVELRAVEPAVPGGPADPRLLTVAVSELRLDDLS